MALLSQSGLLVLLIVVFALPSKHQANAQEVQARHIDRLVRDSAFRSYMKHPRTAFLYQVSIPSSLPGVSADTVRYRSGSLRRYGAELKEFRLAPGVTMGPHVKRLIVVRQNLGNFSSTYSSYKEISGFQLVSPVLGLLFYDAANLRNSTKNHSELGILATKEPITVNFSKLVRSSGGPKTLCALFELDGKVSLSHQSSHNICIGWRQGHFALVIESLSVPVNRDDSANSEKEASGWKVVLASTVAGVLGLVLLGLLVVALANLKKKRSQMAEMERRAYEEEALQISMVGHVRAPTASVARTMPTLENDYTPSL